MACYLKLLLLAFLVLMGACSRAEGAISWRMMRKISTINKDGPYLGLVVPNTFKMSPLLQSPSFVADENFPWIFQRYGDGPDDELAFESGGGFTRKIRYLKFSDYSNGTKKGKSSENLLNNVWFQPEEIYPINGIPEETQHSFWVPVNKHYFAVAKKLEDMKLEGCINSTCLPRTPIVVRVERGTSSNILLDNGAYRQFLHSKFNVTPIDMESAAVALVCLQQRIPFIAFRSLSDLAGGGSAVTNEAATFASLAAENAVSVVLRFIALMS